MKRLLFVASVTFCMLSPQIGDACAAGPYDGEWSGSATATSGRCGPALVTLTVEGKVVTGQARFDRDVANISGTALEHGSVGQQLAFDILREISPRTCSRGLLTVLVVLGK
jgi:hypothetical protein